MVEMDSNGPKWCLAKGENQTHVPFRLAIGYLLGLSVPVCTRPPSHKGDHVARFNTITRQIVFARWKQEETATIK
jgi:hypothetical protein